MAISLTPLQVGGPRCRVLTVCAPPLGTPAQSPAPGSLLRRDPPSGGVTNSPFHSPPLLSPGQPPELNRSGLQLPRSPALRPAAAPAALQAAVQVQSSCAIVSALSPSQGSPSALPSRFLPSSDPSTHLPPQSAQLRARSEKTAVREDPPPSGGCRRGVAGGCRPDPSTGSRGTRGLTCGAGARSSPPWAGAGGASSRLAAIRSGRPAPDRRARALDGEVSAGPRGSRSRAPPSPAPFLPTRRPPPRLKRQSPVSRAPTPPRARGARWERVL